MVHHGSRRITHERFQFKIRERIWDRPIAIGRAMARSIPTVDCSIHGRPAFSLTQHRSRRLTPEPRWEFVGVRTILRPSAPTLKLIATTRRGGRGESIGWVSYRRNEAQELGHDAMRVGGEDPTTARNSRPVDVAPTQSLPCACSVRPPERPGRGNRSRGALMARFNDGGGGLSVFSLVAFGWGAKEGCFSGMRRGKG